MNRICKWFGHRKPTERQSGWFSPGEEYATRAQEAGVDGIQRIHLRIYDRCDRCGEEYLLCRIHVPSGAMKSSYEIIRYQQGNLGKRMSKRLDRIDDVKTSDVYDPQGELWKVRFEQQRDKMIKAGLIDG